MKFISKVKMNLVFFETRKTLIYNSFKPATWDVFFVTSIFHNASSEIEAKSYLKELVANGDLNDYFFTIFNKVKNMNDEVIARILNSSLYPIEKNNRDYSIKFYPSLDLSILEKCRQPIKILDIDYDEEQEMRKLLRDDETFLSVTSDDRQESNISSSYEIGFENNHVFIKVLNDWYEIKPEDFEIAVENKCENINKFSGAIEINPEGDNWKILDTLRLTKFLEKFGFYYQKKWYIFESNYWQELTIAKILENVYFYQLNKIMFSENQTLVAKTLEYLVEKKKHEEVSNKTLLELFSQTDNAKLVQKIINNLLNKKDAKEISRYALKLLMQGVTTNWEPKPLAKMKSFSTEIEQYQELYKINPNLFDFEHDRDIILQFSEAILTEEHTIAISEYKQDRKQIYDAINHTVGEMTSTSGVRENLKKLEIKKNSPSSLIIKRVKKRLNKLAHNQKDYDAMSLATLEKEREELFRFYQTDFMEVKGMIDANNEKLRKGQEND